MRHQDKVEEVRLIWSYIIMCGQTASVTAAVAAIWRSTAVAVQLAFRMVPSVFYSISYLLWSLTPVQVLLACVCALLHHHRVYTFAFHLAGKHQRQHNE